MSGKHKDKKQNNKQSIKKSEKIEKTNINPNKIWDVLIVGAGASGLVCGIEAAKRGKEVCILEQKEKPGKKLYATGNGKCNLGNQIIDSSRYHTVEALDSETTTALFDNILSNKLFEKVIDYFASIGVPVIQRQGYLYPRSEQASTVVQALEHELNLAGGVIQCEETVRQIHHKDHLYMIETQNTCYQAKKLVLATGGCASGKLGSDGSGYAFAQELGHSITVCVPSLCGIHCKEPDWKQLQGVRAKGLVKLINQNVRIEEAGEIQFTGYGVSGIVIFNLSRYISLFFQETKKDTDTIMLTIDLLPERTQKEFLQELHQRQALCGKRSIYDILHGYLPDQLADYLLKRCHIRTDKAICSCSEDELYHLSGLCKEWNIHIVGTNDFEQAQVTAGGVLLREIDLITMESKCSKGLYLTGELLDADGVCGGYNLMWAWETGYRAGNNV